MLIPCYHIRREYRLIGILEVLEHVAERYEIEHEYRANHDYGEYKHQKELVFDEVHYLHDGHCDYVCDKEGQERAQKHYADIRKIVAYACVGHYAERNVEREHRKQASHEIVQIAIRRLGNENLLAADGESQQHFVVAVLI